MPSTERNFFVQPDEAEIRAALNQIIASPYLKNSPQLTNFLTFVVDETLAGRGDRIKAYNIAADALGRDADFDPQHDPIVRVEAGRLRRALDQYYENGGTDDPIIIELPRGHYRPVFRPNKSRGGVSGRLLSLWLQLRDTLRKNYRLIGLIAAIAAATWAAIEVVLMIATGVVWPAIERLLHLTLPA